MIPWRRKWQSTPVFLPGEFHGLRSLAGYSLRGCKRIWHDWTTEHACIVIISHHSEGGKKSVRSGSKELNTLLLHSVIFFIENTKTSTDNLLDIIGNFSKVEGKRTNWNNSKEKWSKDLTRCFTRKGNTNAQWTYWKLLKLLEFN